MPIIPVLQGLRIGVPDQSGLLSEGLKTSICLIKPKQAKEQIEIARLLGISS